VTLLPETLNLTFAIPVPDNLRVQGALLADVEGEIDALHAALVVALRRRTGIEDAEVPQPTTEVVRHRKPRVAGRVDTTPPATASGGGQSGETPGRGLAHATIAGVGGGSGDAPEQAQDAPPASAPPDPPQEATPLATGRYGRGRAA
jgi:hypothetical protein